MYHVQFTLLDAIRINQRIHLLEKIKPITINSNVYRMYGKNAKSVILPPKAWYICIRKNSASGKMNFSLLAAIVFFIKQGKLHFHLRISKVL